MKVLLSYRHLTHGHYAPRSRQVNRAFLKIKYIGGSYVLGFMLLATTLQPRDYQTTIASSACGSNTLAILPTGLGKTVISILVADSRLERYREGRILVLAPTRPLTLQHYNSFRRLLTLPSNHFTALPYAWFTVNACGSKPKV